MLGVKGMEVFLLSLSGNGPFGAKSFHKFNMRLTIGLQFREGVGLRFEQKREAIQHKMMNQLLKTVKKHRISVRTFQVEASIWEI